MNKKKQNPEVCCATFAAFAFGLLIFFDTFALCENDSKQ
jgi:hypothetical protein